MDKKCSFCNKPQQSTAKKFIAGPHRVYICHSCILTCHQHFETSEAKDEKSLRNGLLKPKDIKKYLDQHIISQDIAKKALSVAVYNHYKRIEGVEAEVIAERVAHAKSHDDLAELIDDEVHLTKGNILMVGPTGVGKTALAEKIAELLDVPFIVKDATCLTSAGYVGEDVESIIKSLWEAAGRDVDRAARGIVLLDEVDKIARRNASSSAGRDVGGEGVQQALLKLIESNFVNIQPDGGRFPRSELIQVDTSNILFILCGAFVGLDKIIQRRMSPGMIGFGAKASGVGINSKDLEYNDLIKEVHTEDLTTYGLIPEFIGRLPVLVHLNSLDEEALCDILWKPKNALVKQYQKLFDLNHVELTFTEDALTAIVKEAMKRKSGARGLRSVVENIMLDIMYDIPDMPNVIGCTIDAEVVAGEKGPVLSFREIA